MKTIYKKIAAIALAVPMMLTSCIEETFPTSGVTAGQVAQNSQGLDAIVKGMPAYMKNYQTWSSNAFDFGYPSVLLELGVQTQDMFENPTGYDWFSYWGGSMGDFLYMGSEYIMSQVNWYYFNFMIRSANDVIEAIGTPSSDDRAAALAQAYIYRASTYLDMARIYEFLPNGQVSGVNNDGNDVTGLTVPIITPGMTSEQTNNNPRRPHDEMVEFLLGDLQTAIDLYGQTSVVPTEKIYPSVAVAYGLMARVYMWDENYPKAAEAAKLAYQASGATPLTKAEWTNVNTGFNDSSVSAWMWSIQYEGNDDAVQGGTNWSAFISPETNIGYAGKYGAYFCADKSFYDQISNSDFRKLSFKAPSGHPLAGKEPALDATKFASLVDYAAVKFRPGQGNMADKNVAHATAVPMMRVEEMYLIEAEALAHSNPAEGKAALEDFMKTYRYSNYACPVSDKEGVIEEIILQKRIEFWGEAGITFFDFKRLNMGVTRAYEGTNWPADQRYNVEGRPAWMNWPFVSYEGEFNAGVEGYLNPNIGGVFTPVID